MKQKDVEILSVQTKTNEREVFIATIYILLKMYTFDLVTNGEKKRPASEQIQKTLQRKGL